MAKRWTLTAAALAMTIAASVAAAAPAADSARMARAKDLVADEQWRRAVAELRAAYNDPAEPARDEAAFWLAHSLYQAGDAAAALQAIEQLERKFPRSRWVFPARSLKLEIAHRLNRSDMLWRFATPPPAPPVPAVAPSAPAPADAPPVPPAPPRSVLPAAPPAPAAPVHPAVAPRPRREWVKGPDTMEPGEIALEELDLRIQALGSLMRVEPARAVPILKQVALATEDEDQARRAIFVLMQSNRRDARTAVAEIAKAGPESVTLAAVKQLGLVRSADAARLLADLYRSGTPPVKTQVIRALGRARQPQSLMRIARSESERALQEAAVAALGQAGARVQLATLYRQLSELRLPVIAALFTAGGRTELRQIARTERDDSLRAAATAKLRLLTEP